MTSWDSLTVSWDSLTAAWDDYLVGGAGGNAPNVSVSVAFNAGYSTPASARVWTDVSEWVEGEVRVTHGRSDEFSEVGPSQVTLLLDNRDGRFTWGNTASPYYPGIKVGRPVCVYAWDGAAYRPRFCGYVEEWPVEWDGGEGQSYVVVTALSPMARLGLSAPMGNLVEETYRLESPLVHYQLANTSETYGRQALVSAGASGAEPTFDGIGPDTDGLAAAKLTGGRYFRVPYVVDANTVEICVVTSTPDTTILSVPGESDTYTVEVNSAGFVEAYAPSLGGVGDSATVLTDGRLHHVAVVNDGTALLLYVDGTLRRTASAFGNFNTAAAHIRLGGAPRTESVPTPRPAFNGTLAHFAAYAGALTAAQVADHAAACLTGFAGETPGARIIRYARMAGLGPVLGSFPSGDTPVSHIDTTGQTVLDVMRAAAAVDDGVVHDSLHGDLTFTLRTFNASPALTLSAAAGQIEADVQVHVDRSALVNIATAANLSGSVTVRAVAQSSVDEYGDHRVDLQLATDDAGAITDLAHWRVNTYGEPRPRMPALSVDVLNADDALSAALLGLDVGATISVSGMPSQAPSGSAATYVVEGWSESVSATGHTLTLNLSPASVLQVFEVGHATYGQYDAYPLSY